MAGKTEEHCEFCSRIWEFKNKLLLLFPHSSVKMLCRDWRQGVQGDLTSDTLGKKASQQQLSPRTGLRSEEGAKAGKYSCPTRQKENLTERQAGTAVLENILQVEL